MITREKALDLVKNHVMNGNLVNHMIAVAAIMRRMSEHFNEDQDLWEVVGMLHDIDYEETNDDFSKHGLVSAEMVKHMLPEMGLNAIRAHNERTGVEAKTNMEVSLFAADALSGMIVAGALVRPTKLDGMKAKSIIRRMKDKSFARNISRENIMRCEDLGIQLNEFLSMGIEAMQSVRNEIGM
jgi:putative nucleotidyltransferase with HDIG domain